jgi:hypothetical protein
VRRRLLLGVDVTIDRTTCQKYESLPAMRPLLKLLKQSFTCSQNVRAVTHYQSEGTVRTRQQGGLVEKLTGFSLRILEKGWRVESHSSAYLLHSRATPSPEAVPVGSHFF